MASRQTQELLFPEPPISAWHFEQRARDRGFSRIAGVDEAGRGPLAGPVVAAAVVLPWDMELPQVCDSKLLGPRQRQACADTIFGVALAVGIGVVEATEIDRINILAASLKAMSLAVKQIDPLPDFLLVDGPWPVPIHLPQQPIRGGDGLSVSVAAASIVAKVHRDEIMASHHQQYPHYNFAQNKGYATRGHLKSLADFGPCPIHRLSFRGVRQRAALQETSAPLGY